MSLDQGPSGCWDCAQDPSGKLKQMFVDIVQARRITQGQTPARRPVFLKPHGIAHGWFEPAPRLSKAFKIGVFALGRLKVWVRFSSDALPNNPDIKTTCGVGIKLFGVPGEKLVGDGETQDFIMQNHPIFFVDTAEDMCEFSKAGVVGGDYDPYLRAHPKTDKILSEMAKVESSVLTATYWSVLPYSFGADRYVKYKLEPESTSADLSPPDDANYLGNDLKRRLLADMARFRFTVQFRAGNMPLDQATVLWDEKESTPVHVATVVLPQQDIAVLGQESYGENLSFNPWHCLPEHRPQGSISEARKSVYAASAAQRHDANGIPDREPTEARNSEAIPKVDRCIVRAAIYPSIGVARLGNAEAEYFLGPEVTNPQPEAPGFYRDCEGALKRQAARFRIYGLNAGGQAVAEITAENAEVHWMVHLANKKAAWYQFQLALDVPEAASAPPTLLRNSTVSNRADLKIDPGERHISGRNIQGGPSYTFDTGKFMGAQVYLGELRTDDVGRLVVLGGRGKSASHDGSKAVTFANNDGWHDDISDGPVMANVYYEGQELAVTSAWVVVAPPNYAPQQKSVRTMWDLMRDLAIRNSALSKPVRPSFNADIRPIFERLSNLQWVNAGFAANFGWKGPNNLAASVMLARLSRNSPNDRELRKTIANQFRVFARDAWAQQPWPWGYGDAMNIPPVESPRQNVSLTDTQLQMLQQWASGDFEADYDPAAKPPQNIEELPIAARPDMLTKAALEFCLADAFHPGCEMTWPVRAWSMYQAPFRFLHAPKDWAEPEFGAALIQESLSLAQGPLAAQVPGGITRWMAVPWQTDTASCRSGYQTSYDPYVPTFWPARVPNQVLTQESYEIVLDAKRPLDERLAAFARRADWLAPLEGHSYADLINKMIARFGDLGVVEQRPGPIDPNFPEVVEVSEKAAHQAPVRTESAKAVVAPPQPVDMQMIEKVRRFPHGLRK
jgi:hypothetical protein